MSQRMNFVEDTAALRAVIIKLFSAVMLFPRHYSELKEKQKLRMTFPIFSHMALALLVSRNDDDTVDRTELAKELSHKYTEILIDEYQDTNTVQFELIHSAGNPSTVTCAWLATMTSPFINSAVRTLRTSWILNMYLMIPR